MFESLILLNDRIEGLLARVDFYSYEVQRQMRGVMELSESKRKAILKDQKLLAEYFPLNQRESVKAAIKPVVETLYQVSEVPSLVYNLLKVLNDHHVFLDLNINMTLTLLVLKMISNTVSLLIILFTSSQRHLLFVPDILRKLSTSYDEELEVSCSPVVLSPCL